MHHKNIKLLVRKQLKISADFERLNRKTKREISPKVLAPLFSK